MLIVHLIMTMLEKLVFIFKSIKCFSFFKVEWFNIIHSESSKKTYLLL